MRTQEAAFAAIMGNKAARKYVVAIPSQARSRDLADKFVSLIWLKDKESQAFALAIENELRLRAVVNPLQSYEDSALDTVERAIAAKKAYDKRMREEEKRAAQKECDHLYVLKGKRAVCRLCGHVSRKSL